MSGEKITTKLALIEIAEIQRDHALNPDYEAFYLRSVVKLKIRTIARTIGRAFATTALKIRSQERRFNHKYTNMDISPRHRGNAQYLSAILSMPEEGFIYDSNNQS